MSPQLNVHTCSQFQHHHITSHEIYAKESFWGYHFLLCAAQTLYSKLNARSDV